MLAGCGVDADHSAPAPVARIERAQTPSLSPTHRLDLRGLPREAGEVIALIERGGPFPHPQDGSVFQNRERRLPPRPRGDYREYTVPTPGEHSRGARRIVTGGHPPDVFYYTPDHYRSFIRIPERP
ncbi:ribonuclease [Nitrogeniibacter mangrovi]|uniref:Ribonuclease n=2 Tax=Nitrogeniibacter mangrovi TaxID=2016596 RepID=A0A6C1B827_9RHOO|nr:ribonuclease [Nitrogeniibacter mangrovi]